MGCWRLPLGLGPAAEDWRPACQPALMLVGFIAVGVLPLIDGWENLAKVFPWYYFDGADPMRNGLSAGHLSVLLGSSIALGAAAYVGVNRRDLKGQTVGTTLLDRLRANPMTKKIVDRLAGSTRVSRIWIKSVSEHQGLLIVTGLCDVSPHGRPDGPSLFVDGHDAAQVCRRAPRGAVGVCRLDRRRG